MLSTGATLEAAVAALTAAGASTPMSVAVTHALLVGHAREVLARLPLARLIAADTVAIDRAAPHLEITSLAPLLAAAIRREHRGESLSDLRAMA
jgi:ribose-phosphate pyrophosphokinase